MSRISRVPYKLNTGNIPPLTEKEIQMVLRAADELIGVGGRTMLAKILKGSRDKRVLERGLDKCPAYGFYKNLTLEEVTYRADWMIAEGYLQIEYSAHLPVLVFSEKGWAIEEETYAKELYQRFCVEMKENRTDIVGEMQTVNRQVVFDVLEKIRASGNDSFLPMLKIWKEREVRKVRERISSVENSLRQPSKKEEPVIRKASKDDWREIMNLIQKAARKVYPQYYPESVSEVLCMLYDRKQIQREILEGRLWALWHGGRITGVGSLEENRIFGLYTLPGNKNEEYSSWLIRRLEEHLNGKYEKAEIEAYLPDCYSCEKAGYRTVRHERFFLIKDTVLVYAVMEKTLPQPKK